MSDLKFSFPSLAPSPGFAAGTAFNVDADVFLARSLLATPVNRSAVYLPG